MFLFYFFLAMNRQYKQRICEKSVKTIKSKINITAGGCFINVKSRFFVFCLDVICQRNLLNLSSSFFVCYLEGRSLCHVSVFYFILIFHVLFFYIKMQSINLGENKACKNYLLYLGKIVNSLLSHIHQ